MMNLHLRTNKLLSSEAEEFIKVQSADLANLINQGYPLLPFFPVDPLFEYEENGRRCNILDQFLKAFKGGYGFMPYGVKVYPTMGYLPSHPLLMEIYQVCEDKNIPVTAHCSRGIIHGYRKRVKNIEGWKIGPDGQMTNRPETRWFLTGTQYAHYFNAPQNWEKVLEQFPKLRLNLAHFGGANQWKALAEGKNNSWCSRITDLFGRYPNLYADISFTNAFPDLFELIRSRLERSQLIRERTLYGFDYYMVVVRGHYRSLKADFEAAMGDSLIKQMSMENARRFLF